MVGWIALRRARGALVLTCVLLAGCAAPPAIEQGTRDRVVFSDVIAQVKPVAERQCRQHAPGINCNFAISLLQDRDMKANAYYHRLPSGKPRIVVTSALMEKLHNADELALIVGHEAGHHIAGHFLTKSQDALAAALASWIAAEAAGLQGAELNAAVQAGALKGARQNSRQFELEADRLGAVIARAAGYDPLKASAYLSRAVDLGHAHAGTHPSNAQRIRRLRAQSDQWDR